MSEQEQEPPIALTRSPLLWGILFIATLAITATVWQNFFLQKDDASVVADGKEEQTESSDSALPDNSAPKTPAPNNQPPLAFLSSYKSPLISTNPGFVGPDACRECHQENHSGASQSNHFRACRIVQPNDMPDGFAGETAALSPQNTNIQFKMRRDGDSFWMDTYEVKDSTASPVAQSRLDLVLGSGGKFDDVFLSWKDDGSMFELPMAWLYPSHQWATSHFDPYSSGDHSRPLTVRCLECHNTWINHVKGTANQYLRDEMILGVTCESCHGPAEKHVRYYREHPNEKAPAGQPAAHIISPSDLSREQRIALCSQCHSNTMKRRTTAFTHRSDQPIEASFKELTNKNNEDDHVANQTRFMKESKCFKGDQKMTCVTCHDPHEANKAQESHSSSCYQCHKAEACKDRPNLPNEVRDQCAECHMPLYVKINVNFQLEDDNFVTPIRRWQHRIGIYPEAKKELLRDWLAKQEDPESKDKAKKLTEELVDHYLGQLDQCQADHRFVGAIAAGREALRIDDNPVVRERLKAAIAIETRLEEFRSQANRALAQRQFPEAMKLLKQIIEIKPDDAIAQGRLGTCYAELGDMKLAEEHWKAVEKYDPDDVYGLGMLAWMAFRQNRLDDSLALYRHADEIEPYEAKVKYQIGMILAKQNKLREALPWFQAALAIEPLNDGALQAIIGTYRQLGRAKDAIPYAQDAVAFSQLANPDVLMVLADICAEAEQTNDAIEAATLARKIAERREPRLIPLIEQRLFQYREAAKP